jgi:hypothetical protein
MAVHKVIVALLIKKFPAFYGAQSLVVFPAAL